MALSIIALCIFIFGAYVYGSVVVLTLRHRSPVWSKTAALGVSRFRAQRVGLAMYAVCTLWFLLHSAIEFRYLLGEPRENDLIDLAALELVFVFPGLILHTVLTETHTEEDGTTRPRARIWSTVLAALYIAGAAMAVYFTGAIFDLIPAPDPLGPYIGFSIGSLFTVSSVCCLGLMATRSRPAATLDQRRMRISLMSLFVVMIGVFVTLSFIRERGLIISLLDVLVRTTPLLFLLVSVYFVNRTEFYDLVVKRGVIMLISLLMLAALVSFNLFWLDGMAGGMARPWLFAIALLPAAMVLPWVHDRVGRLLDQLWFGRDFTPVEAVRNVLAVMQQATDEPSLVAATEATLSEMFRRRVVILVEGQPAPERAITADIRTASSTDRLRLAVVDEPGLRPMLSEDLALLRSLGNVFGFMLDNVRLQRKRQEQEQLAQALRLQSSRSELKALRAQINPHFLFNALNAIASLIHTDPTRADAVVEQLAEVFRYTLRRSENEWTTLDQELAFAHAYLDVEQARFGRRLSFSIEADPSLNRAQVPSMLLQTLVENAVKHGISRLRQPGRINIRARVEDARLCLEVRDTGPGLDNEDRQRPATGESFGLRSIRDRLEGHFGANASLEVTRDEATGETVARIVMPLVADEHTAVAIPR
jgi:signal transduction histidine kinase